MAETSTTRDIVAKLWNLCHILRDDGVTYNEYVTELTFLLFLKMMAETGREEILPNGYRWSELDRRTGMEQLDYYKRLLLDLGTKGKATVAAIFVDAQTKLRKPTNLKALTDAIDKLDWFSAREEGLGNLYEGLLEKNAAEKKSGAGQYFTPRPLIDCIVRLMQPQAGEIIQDPAAGTGGFIVAADRFIKDHTDDLFKLPKEAGLLSEAQCLRRSGVGSGCAPALPDEPHAAWHRGRGRIRRHVCRLTASASEGGPHSHQSAIRHQEGRRPAEPRRFFDHVRHIQQATRLCRTRCARLETRRARRCRRARQRAVFEDNTGRRLRTWMMELCDLHTILRLPTGIFYAQGVKTNVLFFTRGKTDKANTKAVWVYDLRNQMEAFGKTRPLTVADFADFENAFGNDPLGNAKRQDQGDEGRFRCFTREEIKDRNDNLDIGWLRDTEAEVEEHLTEPEDITAAITAHLRAALEQVDAIDEELASELEKQEGNEDRDTSEVPQGWTTATLTDLAGSNGLLADGDWVETKDQDPNGPIRLTHLADIGDGKFLDKSSRFMNVATASRLGCTFLKKGDLLIARMPDPLGRACIFPGLPNPAVTAVDVFIWRRDENGADARWLMHFINSPEIRQTI